MINNKNVYIFSLYVNKKYSYIFFVLEEKLYISIENFNYFVNVIFIF